MRTMANPGFHPRLLVVTAALAVTAGVWPLPAVPRAAGPAPQAAATPQPQPLTADQLRQIMDLLLKIFDR